MVPDLAAAMDVLLFYSLNRVLMSEWASEERIRRPEKDVVLGAEH